MQIDVTLLCGGAKITTFTIADFIVKDSLGVTIVPSSIVYNPTSELYEITGVGFANGDTVELVASIEPEIIYVGANIVTIALI